MTETELTVLNDSRYSDMVRQEVVESLRAQAVGGNAVAVAALERMEKETRYQAFLAGMDDDEDPATPIPD